MGYQKDIFAAFAHELKLSHKSRQSRVYHHCESEIQPSVDEIRLRR